MLCEKEARRLHAEMAKRPSNLIRSGLLGELRSNFTVSLDWVSAGGKKLPFGNALARERPTWKPAEHEVLLSSLHFACLVVDKFLVDGGIYIPELDDSIRAVDRLLVFWSKRGGNPNQGASCGYDCADGSRLELVDLLRTDGRAAKEILSRLGFNLFSGAGIPQEASFLVGAVLRGELIPPLAPKREPTQRQRDTLLVAIADGLRARTHYAGSANHTAFQRGSPPKVCGCTIAAAALTAFKIPVDAIRARKIYMAKKKLPVDLLNFDRMFDFPPLTGGTLAEGAQNDVSVHVFRALKVLQTPL